MGSEAKGSIAGHLARTCHNGNLLAVRVAGPNAGHTIYDDDGERWSFRQLPVAAIARPDAQLAIAAGSEVDLRVLFDEIQRMEERKDGEFRNRLLVDRSATRVTDAHIIAETGIHEAIGSTGKGVGAARAARAMREAMLVGDIEWTFSVGGVADTINATLEHGGEVHIEGTQGYGLGLHAGFYPQCTSSDCTAVDFLSMAGVSPWSSAVQRFEVWVVFRTFPIRVAGNSGPLKGELSWEQLCEIQKIDIEPERTTVTNKIRRIGTWDGDLAYDALCANGAPSPMVHTALMFVDYLNPADRGCPSWADLSDLSKEWISYREQELGYRFELLGTSETTIIDRRRDREGVISETGAHYVEESLL